jgi:transposase
MSFHAFFDFTNFFASLSSIMDSAGKRLRSSPETAQESRIVPDQHEDGAQGELRLRWFHVKDNPNATVHVIKRTMKPMSQVEDSARVYIIEDVNWEVARLEKEAAEAAGGPVAERSAFLSRAVQTVAEYYHISTRTVNNMRHAWKEKGSPTRMKRSGRPRVYGDEARASIIEALNFGNGRTVEQATRRLEMTFPLKTTTRRNGHVRHSPSYGMVETVMLEGKKVRVARRPVLSLECMLRRLSFSQELLSCLGQNPIRAEVHLDEAYITLAFGGTGVLIEHPLCPELEAAKIKFLKSRSHSSQIMVLMVIAKPTLLNPLAAGAQGAGEVARFDGKQNGKVALFRVVEEFTRKKKWSKKGKDGVKRTHEVGDVIVKPANLNSIKYQTLMTQPAGILDKIRAYYGPDVKVTLQEDGAPPHGRITKNTVACVGVHEKLVAIAKERFIDLVRQPPNSPELNACDLGVWRSLQSGVKAMNLEDTSWNDTHGAQERLWKAIQQAWSDIKSQTIFNVFEVRNEIAKELVENEGRVIVKEPHAGVREKWGTG